MKKIIDKVIYESDYEIVKLLDEDTVGILFKNLYDDKEIQLPLKQYFEFYSGDEKCSQEVIDKIAELTK